METEYKGCTIQKLLIKNNKIKSKSDKEIPKILLKNVTVQITIINIEHTH